MGLLTGLDPGPAGRTAIAVLLEYVSFHRGVFNVHIQSKML